MLIAIDDIAKKGIVSYPAVYNKVFFYGIPIFMRLKPMIYRDGERHYYRKYIDAKYEKYILTVYDKKFLQDIVIAWYESKTTDPYLLTEFDREFETMGKNDLMKLCIFKKLI